MPSFDKYSIQTWKEVFSDFKPLIKEESLGRLSADQATFHLKLANSYLVQSGNTLESHEIKKLDQYSKLLRGDIQEGVAFRQKLQIQKQEAELRKWEIAETGARMGLTLLIAYLAAPAAAGAATAALADATVASTLAAGAQGAALAASAGAGVGLGSSSATAFGLMQAMGIGLSLGGLSGGLEVAGKHAWKDSLNEMTGAEVWTKVKSEALNGAITAIIPAFSRIKQTMALKSAGVNAFGHYASDIAEGSAIGAIDASLRDITAQKTDEEQWSIQWGRVVEAAKTGAMFGAAGAAVLAPAMRVAGSALKDSSKNFTHTLPPEPRTWNEAVEEILEYRPPPWSLRYLIGGIQRALPEGMRRLPLVIQNNPAIRALFMNARGVVDFEQALSPHKQAQFLEHLGINIVKDKAALAALNPASRTYHADYMRALKDVSEIDDQTLAKLLRFLGVNFRSGSAAEAENLGYARMGWKNTQRLIKDNDETSNNGWAPHPLSLNPIHFPKVAWHFFSGLYGKAPAPFQNGSMSYLVYNRNRTFEIAKAVSTGRLIPIKTDNVKPFMLPWFQMFSTDRYAHMGKLPFQHVTLAEVRANPLIVDASDQVEGLKLLLQKLKGGYLRLDPLLQKTVAVAAHDPHGYKMKMWTLDRLRRPDLPEVWDATLIDNHGGYTRMQELLGKTAVEVQDRLPPILPGVKYINDAINYGAADPLGGLNLLARRMGWPGLEEFTNNMGWYNHLPSRLFGLNNYLLPALQKIKSGTARVVRMNTPTTGLNRLYKPVPSYGLKPGNQIQAGSYTIDWAYFKTHFQDVRGEAKGLIREIREELERQRVWEASLKTYGILLQTPS